MFDVDRILAIPDDQPNFYQMGLSTHNRGVLRARGYKRTDGIEAKDRFIKLDKKLEAREKAVIKGDKPLAEAPKELTGAARIRARFEQKQREQYNIPANVSVTDFLAEKEKQRKDDVEKNKSQRKKTWGEVERKDYSKKSDYHLAEIEALKDNATVNALEKNKTSISEVESTLEKERKRFSKLSERGMDQMSGGKRSTSKATAAYGAQLTARNIDTLEKYLDARKGLDSALKAENTPIAPDTAKKIKGAIAGVKGGKVVKGVKPSDRGAAPTAKKLSFEAGTLETIKSGLKRSASGTPSRIKTKNKAFLSRDKAIDYAFPTGNPKDKKSFGALTSDQIRKLDKRYPDLKIKDQVKFDYSPETAKVGDKLAYIRPTYEHVQKGLNHEQYRITSIKGDGATKKVYGVPLDKNGNQLSDKQIPIVSNPFNTNGKKGDRYRRLVFDTQSNESKPKQPSATAKKVGITAEKEADILKRLKKY